MMVYPLKVNGRLSRRELRALGYTLRDLRRVSHTARPLVADRLRKAGLSLRPLVKRYTYYELRALGVTNREMVREGYEVFHLLCFGATVRELLEENFTFRELAQGGAFADELMTAGCPPEVLLSEGYHPDVILQAWAPMPEIWAAQAALSSSAQQAG